MIKTIKSRNNYDINCNTDIDKNNDKIYIFLHGLGGNQRRPAVLKVIETLEKIGIGAITFDFVGHGESKVDFNKFSIQNCVDDLNDVIKYVKTNYPNKKIGLFGTSMGGHIILKDLLKNNIKVDSIVLKSPAIDIFGAVQNLKPYFDIDKKSKNFVLPLLKNFEFNEIILNDFINSTKELLKSQNKINAKTLIIQGQKDDIAPSKTTENFAKAHFDNYTLKLFSNADHNFANDGELEVICNLVKEFETNLKENINENIFDC